MRCLTLLQGLPSTSSVCELNCFSELGCEILRSACAVKAHQNREQTAHLQTALLHPGGWDGARSNAWHAARCETATPPVDPAAGSSCRMQQFANGARASITSCCEQWAGNTSRVAQPRCPLGHDSPDDLHRGLHGICSSFDDVHERSETQAHARA